MTPEPVTFTRRRFLVGAGASAALAGLTLPSVKPRLAFATPNEPASGDVLVCVFLRGAADGLSMVVPYADSGYRSLRGAGTTNDITVPPPDTANPTNTTLPLDGGGGIAGFGLHPGMGGADGTGGLKAVWDTGDLAIVHAVGMPASESATRSHFESQANWERGTADLAVPTGWLARHLASTASPGGIPGVGHASTLQASLHGEPRAVSMSTVPSFGVAGYRDNAGVKNVLADVYAAGATDTLVQEGNETLTAVDLVAAENPGQYNQNAALYNGFAGPFIPFASGLREIAELIRADIGLRVACVDVGDWDTHDQMGPVTGGWMRDQVTGLANALAAFHQDLGPLKNEVTLVTMSDFGRCIQVNGNNGTDHGRGSCQFVMGGNVNKGIWGDYPDGPLQDGPEGDLTVANDVRQVLAEIVTRRLDNPHLDQVFPGYTHPGDLGVVH